MLPPMHPGPVELQEFLALALRCARAGGDVLRAHRTRLGRLSSESKGRRRELVTEADREAEEAVVGGLLAACPEHAVLAEEGALTPRGATSSSSDFVWVVDPLDGTTNFVHGLPYHAVAVALVHRGAPVVAVVHAPALETTWTATLGGGAHRDGLPIRVSDTTELADALIATGFSYGRDEPGHDDNLGRLARVLPDCRDVRRYGSAEIDLCLTAEGTWDAYWELDLMPYDVAAGALCVREAGGRVTDLVAGDDWLHGGQILASNGRLHEPMLARVGGAP